MPTTIVSTICDDRGEEPTYAGITMSELMETDSGVGDVVSKELSLRLCRCLCTLSCSKGGQFFCLLSLSLSLPQTAFGLLGQIKGFHFCVLSFLCHVLCCYLLC